ncbi:MAG: hypothetical protein ACJ72N_07305 [Labedaea sp.]
MSKADEIARSVGWYDSISAFLAMLRRYADDADSSDRVIFLHAARVVTLLVTEVDNLTAEVKRLSDKIDDLKEVIRNRQER